MTDESRGIEAAGPPWSVDLLADLHAGVLDEAASAELWPRVQADPEARAIIEALEATTADLASLGTSPAPPMPADVAARIDAALAEEAKQAAPVAPVVSIDAARRRRNRRIGWISGVVAVAAAAVAAVAIAVPGSQDTTGSPVAIAPTSSPEQSGSSPGLAVRSDQPQAAVGKLSTGVKDYGPLGDAQGLSRCLQAAGFTGAADPIGVQQGTIDGKPAVLVLLTTGRLAEFRLVALSPECGSTPLLDKVVGK
ncbi:hypothetical protein FPZ12_000265 [Amycolatopsis acidicola]|uniref:Anti-sigma factor n=1 Tax=Amycolatopsis acidicola TaxID=2596893 RepID=A0A5N0VMC2_9PSEU|nr:hypothetical protein [Amycolatopsis acidicola]KAA9166693.1 hypothetical protein FPZ12_000265 [Amycolatopsis acidicola]